MSTTHSWLRATALVFLVLIPVLALLIVCGMILFWGFGIDKFGDNAVVLVGSAPVAGRRIAGLLGALPATLFALMALGHLFGMFLGFWRAEAFGLATIRHLKGFAFHSLMAAVSAFLLSGVMRWALGVFDHAPLWTHLGFSVTHAVVIFNAAIVFVASRFIEEGYSYKQQMEEFV